MSIEKFQKLVSTVVPLPIENVDTDQIIPARFLKAVERKGFGDNLFRDWRYKKDGTPNPNERYKLDDITEKNSEFKYIDAKSKNQSIWQNEKTVSVKSGDGFSIEFNDPNLFNAINNGLKSDANNTKFKSFNETAEPNGPKEISPVNINAVKNKQYMMDDSKTGGFLIKNKGSAEMQGDPKAMLNVVQSQTEEGKETYLKADHETMGIKKNDGTTNYVKSFEYEK